MGRTLSRTWLVVGLLLFGGTVAVAAPRVYKLHVDGLACPFCAYGIEKQLSRIEAVTAIDTDIETGVVTLTTADNTTLDEATVRRAVEAAGFRLRKFESLATIEPKKPK